MTEPGVLRMSHTTAVPERVAAAEPAGRAAEARRVRALVHDLAGRGGALLVTGEPGIGKTTLLDVARAEARALGATLLDVAGVAVEGHLPFAGLQRIVHPLAASLPGLAEPQRRALLRAVGGPAHEGPAPTLFVLGLALLELLGRAGETGPVVLVVDDAQWLDPPSTEVLGFVGRRLAGDRAALLLASREQSVPDALQDLPAVRLGPLAPDVARRLVIDAAPTLREAQVQHVLDVAGGNPLALQELARLVGQGVRVGEAAGTPLTERLERVFGLGSASLSRPTRTLLLVMAVADGGDHEDARAVAARVGGSSVDADLLAPAVVAGLVTRAAPAGFSHPLVRSALVRTAPPGLLREVHLAWADHLAVTDPDRSAWHRAATTDGPDAAVASALEAAADHAQQRGAPVVAARWLQRSVELSDGAARTSRLLRLVELDYRLGRPDEAQAALAAVRAGALTGVQNDRLLWLEEAFDDSYAAVERVPDLLAGAARARARGEPGEALQLLDAAARRCWWSGRAAPEVAAAADGLVAADDPRLLVVHAHAATLERGPEVLGALAGWARRPVPDPEAGAALARAAFNLADFGHALHFSASAVERLRELGQVAGVAQLQVLAAWSGLILGRWELACAAADEAYRLSVETRQPAWAAHARLAQADHQGRLGHTRRALELVADAERLALSTGRATTLSGVEFVRGTIELGRGRPTEAYEHLHRSFDPTDRAYHPVERLWLLDHLSEAAARTDAAPRVRLLLAEVGALVEHVPSPGYHQSLRLARVHLAEDDEIDGRVEEARTGPGRTSCWFDARVDLAHGLSLRRRRRIADARHVLRRALVAFDELGAQAWGDRARAELAASGAAVEPPTEHAWRSLSPQELQIARLASAGLTNREIGSRLYLSHRTVGSHLYRIFPKLGVTSRRQLESVLQREATA